MMDNYCINEINQLKIDDDCFGLVCYVKADHMPKRMMNTVFDHIREQLTECFAGKDIKILVLPDTYRIEVLTKASGQGINIIENKEE